MDTSNNETVTPNNSDNIEIAATTEVKCMLFSLNLFCFYSSDLLSHLIRGAISVRIERGITGHPWGNSVDTFRGNLNTFQCILWHLTLLESIYNYDS